MFRKYVECSVNTLAIESRCERSEAISDTLKFRCHFSSRARPYGYLRMLIDLCALPLNPIDPICVSPVDDIYRVRMRKLFTCIEPRPQKVNENQVALP